MKRLHLLVFCIFITIYSIAQPESEWRGPGRSGIYPESDLLKVWPENGPAMIWFTDSLPDGYSAVAVTPDKVYLTGIVDSLDALIALDINGKKLWQTSYGRAWDASYQPSRSTPTVDNNKVYVSSGKGDIACIDGDKGNIIWSVKASEKFGGTLGRWGLAESLLIDGEKVFFTTGGDLTTMLAFNKNNGELIWKSESLKDNPSYTSPVLIEKDGKKQIVNVTENFIFAVEPANGKIAWKFDFGSYKKERNNNTNTPIYFKGELFVTSGYDHKSVKLKLADDLSSVSLLWVDTVLDVHHGGVVKIGNYLYGSNWEHNRMGRWVCLDWNTGKVQYETEWINKGSIIAADGMLYCFEEKTGNMAMIKANPEEFKIISSFKVPKGKGPYWAHPVIKDGVLYVRHGGAVMAYDIKE